MQYAGILRALRDDLEAGYTRRIEELVHAEVFDDFLDMASEPHGKSYDAAAAAVIAGSVLEEHLRKLAAKAEIDPVPHSVEDLGAQLRKNGTLTEPERKIVQGWYGRAHRERARSPRARDPEEVGRMIPGIRGVHGPAPRLSE